MRFVKCLATEVSSSTAFSRTTPKLSHRANTRSSKAIHIARGSGTEVVACGWSGPKRSEGAEHLQLVGNLRRFPFGAYQAQFYVAYSVPRQVPQVYESRAGFEVLPCRGLDRACPAVDCVADIPEGFDDEVSLRGLSLLLLLRDLCDEVAALGHLFECPHE